MRFGPRYQFYRLVRLVAPYRFTLPIKLDVGCGDLGPKPGFIGVDIRKAPGVKLVCNAWELNNYLPRNSVEIIYSRHFFEHLTFAQSSLTLHCWHKLLVPGGAVELIVPDLQYHITQFLSPVRDDAADANPAWTHIQHALAGFWGWQREGDKKIWDVHKSGYDFSLLKKTLLMHGFRDITRIEDKPWNLSVRFVK